mgnify:FL=1
MPQRPVPTMADNLILIFGYGVNFLFHNPYDRISGLSLQGIFGIVHGMDYVEVDVDVQKVLEDWRGSLRAHVWLAPDGRIRDLDDLPDSARESLMDARKEAGEPPILGIGITDCVEICTGAARFMMQAARGDTTITVRIRPKQQSDLKDFIV